MKKVIAVVAMLLSATSAFAANNTLLEGTKASDGWRIALSGGVIAPLQFNKLPNDNYVAETFGVDVRKDITPVWGLGLEGRWGIDANQMQVSSNAIDTQYIGVFGTLNFMNLFGGYKGKPRLFDIEAQGGIGWLHYYFSKTNNQGPDMNSFGTKLGLNFNFNLGDRRAWILSIRPYVLFDLSNSNSYAQPEAKVTTVPSTARFDSRTGNLGLEVSIAYRFKGSNGKNYFTLAKAYDQEEVNGLNNKINDLRGELAHKQNILAAQNDSNAQVQKALDECLAKPAQVVENKTQALESVVTFSKASSSVPSSQMPNVERIATYLKNHKDSKVTVRGYASPEGSQEYNTKLANSRAEAVKNILVKKYKISADRIDSEGQGIGDMFSEPDWNRVTICKINE